MKNLVPWLCCGALFLTGCDATDFLPQLDDWITENATDVTAPVLSNIGVSFNTWDMSTGVAGDFLFLDSLLVPPGQEDDNTLTIFFTFGSILTNPLGTRVFQSFEYRPNPNADVLAVTGGIVSRVAPIPAGDFDIFIRPNDHSFWRIRQEHISLPQVSEGDVVQAGDVLGQPGFLTFSGLGLGIGRTELFVENLLDGTDHCPIFLLSPAVRADIEARLTQFFIDWESFKSNSNIFDEASMIVPGCTAESALTSAPPAEAPLLWSPDCAEGEALRPGVNRRPICDGAARGASGYRDR